MTRRTIPFFEPNHTYTRRRWRFQCLAVALSPFDGEIRAVGFLYRPGEPATATAMDVENWELDEWIDAANPDAP